MKSETGQTHDATWLVDNYELAVSVLVQYLDTPGRDRGLMAMDDIFDAVAVAHDRVRLGDLPVDSSDARFERISLRNRNEPEHAKKKNLSTRTLTHTQQGSKKKREHHT
jgi:hypothetical protein